MDRARWAKIAAVAFLVMMFWQSPAVLGGWASGLLHGVGQVPGKVQAFIGQL